jgi:uncharacterized protein (TIGR02996 family)
MRRRSVDEEAGFLVALELAPADLTTHLVYADWLDEHSDPGGECLRVWVEFVRLPYEDTTYRLLQETLERFQAALRCADPDWVELVGRVRDWVDAALAEKAARLHLRVRHGRKSDRQWVERPVRSVRTLVWGVPYWRHNPAELKGTSWRVLRNRGEVQVDPVSATASEPPPRRAGVVPGDAQPA